MDAPGLQGAHFVMAYGTDCTRTSGLCMRPRAAVPDGIGWSAPDRFRALAVLQSLWVWPTKVLCMLEVWPLATGRGSL